MTVVSDSTAILAYLEYEAFRWNAPVDLGTGTVVSYSFASGDALPTGFEMPYGGTARELDASQQATFRSALAMFEAVTNITFVEVNSGPAMISALGATGLDGNVAGYANYPYSTASYTGSGEVVLEAAPGADLGGSFFDVVLHEIGHALGLSHPFDGALTLAPSLDNSAVTVMSYNDTGFDGGLGYLDEEALAILYGTLDHPGPTVTLKDGAFKSVFGDSDDSYIGALGQNFMHGNGGNDTLVGREDADKLFGGDGHDALTGQYGDDTMQGGDGRDTLEGGNGADRIEGDTGGDQLHGGDGNDSLAGGSGADTLRGGTGNDLLESMNSADVLYGGDGNDDLSGASGADKLWGDGGSDTLRGGDGKDTLSGGDGADEMIGGNGNDKLMADDNSHYVFGEILDGGPGSDKLFAGVGSEEFRFKGFDDGDKDTVVGFELYNDWISLGGILSKADMLFRDKGADTKVIFDAGDHGEFSIVFKGIDAATLEAAWDGLLV